MSLKAHPYERTPVKVLNGGGEKVEQQRELLQTSGGKANVQNNLAEVIFNTKFPYSSTYAFL